MNIRSIVLFLLTSFILSCTQKQSGTAASPQAPLKIGFVLATLNEERYAKDQAYFLEAAKALGATVEFAGCDDKVTVQTSKVETLLSKGVQVLVIQPVNGDAASTLVSMASRDGVPVIAYDRLIKGADIAAYVTQDSFKVGVLQAEEAIKATGGKGNYIVLSGEAGHSVAQEITRGALSVLEKYPQIKVVTQQSHPGWSTALALATVENTLTRYKNNIQAILANNDGMALGAVQAVEEQKLAGKVFIAGADADLAAVRGVVSGKQSVTILKGIKPLAESAAKAAVALARKESLHADAKVFNGKAEIPVINTPVTLITKSNVAKEIIETGFHSQEAVFGSTPRS